MTAATTKPTLATLAADRLPSAPEFDLATEPWIPVTDPDGQGPRRLSLADLYAQAHEVVLDGAPYGPLHEHALTRLLIAHTYIAHANDPTPRLWNAVVSDHAPLPQSAFAAVLGRFADRHWLHHPDTPFLQDLTVLEVMDGQVHKDPDTALLKSTHPYWTLLPDIPSKSNAAWFNRHGELPAPTCADAANALVLRHYFALPGNESPNRAAGGKTSKGGPTGLTNNGRSYAFFRGPTLATTLVANLLDDWLDRVVPDTPTFWEQPDAVAANTENPLWAYTASGAATVLIPVPDVVDPAGYLVVRTPAPLAKQDAAQLKELMQGGDPHALKVPPKSAAAGTRSYEIFPAAASDLDLIRRFHSKVRDRTALLEPSVLRPRATRYRARLPAEFLNVVGAGTSTGPSVAEAATVRPDPESLLVTPDVADAFTTLAERVVYGKDSAGNRLAAALGRLSSGGTPDWVRPTAQAELAHASEPVLRRLLELCVATPADQPLPTDLPDPDRTAIRAAALDVFDRLARRLGSGPAHDARVARERSRLRRTL